MQKQQNSSVVNSKSSLKQKNKELSIEWMSRKLCSAREISLYNKRKAYFKSKQHNNVALFPVWRQYRQQATQVLRLRQVCPWLKFFPLTVSTLIARYTSSNSVA